MNVIQSLDEQVVAKARRIAAVPGTSPNHLIRDYLEEITHLDDAKSAIDQLDALWAGSAGRSQGPCTRGELQERP